jgi:hypothetical protein
LHGYFEPTAEEEEQGLKVPTAAHRAIARLVKAGLIRVILTINFDRLMEHALDAAGVAHVVTATPAAVAGALPLHLQRCQVIKLHGDYLDPGMLNTPEELASYDPRADRLLDQVFDEYGLIVAGWSATYDRALRSAIERAASRRFSSWWIDPGEISDHARRIIANRASTVVQATGDTFFAAVADAVESLARLDAPSPQTVALATAAAKRALGPAGDRIRLHDLMKEEISRVSAAPQVTAANFQSGSVEAYGLEVQRLEATTETLLSVVAIAAYWGDRSTDEWWMPSITTFSERAEQSPASGLTSFINLTRYPGLLLFQAGAIAAVAANRWDLFARLDSLQLDTTYDGLGFPASIALDPPQLLGGYSTRSGRSTGVQSNDDPARHLRELMKAVFTKHLLLTKADFERAAATAEYLLEVSSYDWKRTLPTTEGQANAYAPTRIAGFSLPRSDEWKNARPRIAAQVRAFIARDMGFGMPSAPLAAGMFGGDLTRFTAAAEEFDTEYQSHQQQRRFSNS